MLQRTNCPSAITVFDYDVRYSKSKQMLLYIFNGVY